LFIVTTDLPHAAYFRGYTIEHDYFASRDIIRSAVSFEKKIASIL